MKGIGQENERNAGVGGGAYSQAHDTSTSRRHHDVRHFEDSATSAAQLLPGFSSIPPIHALSNVPRQLYMLLLVFTCIPPPPARSPSKAGKTAQSIFHRAMVSNIQSIAAADAAQMANIRKSKPWPDACQCSLLPEEPTCHGPVNGYM